MNLRVRFFEGGRWWNRGVWPVAVTQAGVESWGSGSHVFWRQIEACSQCARRLIGSVDLQHLPCKQSSFPFSTF